MAEAVTEMPTPGNKLENGVYMVGVVRGITVREGTSKDGNHYRIESVVVEGNNFSQSRFTLTKAQSNAGWADRIEKELAGKRCFMAVSITRDNNGYMQSRLRGDEFPKALKS